MRVLFRRPWWNGEQLFQKVSGGVEVPDRYKDLLPSNAKILSAGEVEKEPELELAPTAKPKVEAESKE